ncbi:hypothetical protein LINPERHAP1_LOCUS23107 [Linum perenne]
MNNQLGNRIQRNWGKIGWSFVWSSSAIAHSNSQTRNQLNELKPDGSSAEVTMRKSCNATDHWVQRGGKRQPKQLTNLLRKATFEEGFNGVREFDSSQVPSLEGEEPPQYWSLPIVTLTAIAVALPDVGSCSVKHRISSTILLNRYTAMQIQGIGGDDLRCTGSLDFKL